MNELIRKLADDADFSLKDLYYREDDYQKFAELIIEECISACECSGFELGKTVSAREVIKQRFGLE